MGPLPPPAVISFLSQTLLHRLAPVIFRGPKDVRQQSRVSIVLAQYGSVCVRAVLFTAVLPIADYPTETTLHMGPTCVVGHCPPFARLKRDEMLVE